MEQESVNYWISVGEQRAKKRIIELLEEQKKIFSSPQYSTTGGNAEQFALNQAIALIKGEN